MPRRPIACATCAKPMNIGSRSLPEGEATCQECRRARSNDVELKPPQEWNCVVCGEHVVSKRRGDQLASNSGKYCPTHSGHAQCTTCAEWFPSVNYARTTTNHYCSDDCRIDAGVLPNGNHHIGTQTDLDWRECSCGRWFGNPAVKFCEPSHRYLAKVNKPEKPARPCPDCDAPLAKGCQRCDECRSARKKAQKKAGQGSKHRRRARHYGVEYEPVHRGTVFFLDDWTCGICSEPVDKRLQYPDPMSVSLDHIIPMSRGGGHTYANTQCSHWICNVVKSDHLESAVA